MADNDHSNIQAFARRTSFLFTAPTSSNCCSSVDYHNSRSTTSTSDNYNNSMSIGNGTTMPSLSSHEANQVLLPPIVLHSTAPPRLPAPLRRVSDTVLPAARRSFSAGQLLSPMTGSAMRPSFSSSRPRARDLSPLYVAASFTPPGEQRQSSAPPSALIDQSLLSPTNVYRVSSLRDTTPSPAGPHPGSLSSYSLSSLGGRHGNLRRSPSWHAGLSRSSSAPNFSPTSLLGPRSPLSLPTSPLSLFPPSSSRCSSLSTPPSAAQHVPTPPLSPVITPTMLQHWPGQRQSLSENWYGTDLAFALKSPDVTQAMPEWIQKGYPSPTYLQREEERVASIAALKGAASAAAAETPNAKKQRKRANSTSVSNKRSSKRIRAVPPIESKDSTADRDTSAEPSPAYTRFLRSFSSGLTRTSGSSIALRRISSRIKLVCPGTTPARVRRASARIASSSQESAGGVPRMPLSSIDVNAPDSSASTRSVARIVVKRSNGDDSCTKSVKLVYPKPAMHAEGRLTSTPPQDQLIETINYMEPVFQQPKFRGDLYTPAYARVAKGGGKKVNSVEKGSKEGWCGLCPVDDPKHPGWLHLKNSSYRYHLIRTHGVSPRTLKIFKAPADLRLPQLPEGTYDNDAMEGKCTVCSRWIPISRTSHVKWSVHASACYHPVDSDSDS